MTTRVTERISGDGGFQTPTWGSAHDELVVSRLALGGTASVLAVMNSSGDVLRDLMEPAPSEKWLYPMWSHDEESLVCERLVEGTEGIWESQIVTVDYTTGEYAQHGLGFTPSFAVGNNVLYYSWNLDEEQGGTRIFRLDLVSHDIEQVTR
jgi:hypothetical protein